MHTELYQPKHAEGLPVPPPGPETPQEKKVKASDWFGKVFKKLLGEKDDGGEQPPLEQLLPEEPLIFALPEVMTSSVDAALDATLSSIAQAEQSAEGDPTAQLELAQLRTEARRITAETLRKIGEQLGSNRGGWYEDEQTKERFYVKLYENPDQARAEFIANAIYAKLGIRSVRSELFEMDGRLAIASREIPEPTVTSAEEQTASTDVRGGFVADVYLANWDVVGLVHDNIVRGSDGRDYRIDNGGSLTFRAQGGPKAFAADAVPELESMRNPSYPAGRVFGGIMEDELRQQAEHLARSLAPADIDAILKRSGLTGPVAETIRAGLIGRRRVLMERFDIAQQFEPSARTAIASERLRAQYEQLRSVELRPRVGILADSGTIENQQVDIIEHPDRYDITFKLTAAQYEKICTTLRGREQRGKGRSTEFTYGSGERSYNLSQAWEIRVGTMRILVSKAQSAYGGDVRSALGLVRIEVPREGGGPMPADVGERIHRVLQRLFGAEGGFLPPTPEAEAAYKWQRYTWHHKLDASGERPPDWDKVEKRLERQEVAPGYFTMVDPGRHREYAARSPFAIIHTIQHHDAIAKIVRAGGLLSTHERYRRGLLLSGMSSMDDLRTGGADSVFTQTMTEAGLTRSNATKHRMDSEMTVILDPSVLDRTDWYAYEVDQYGRTDPETFSSRQSPEKLFDRQRDSGWRPGNEQMFRTGIGTEHIRAIVCHPSGWQEKTRTMLASAGITEVAGIPIDELIRRGAGTLRTALKDAGIEWMNGRDPVAIAEAKRLTVLVDTLNRGLTAADWEAIQRVRSYTDRAALFALDTDSIMSVLRDAGLEHIGTRPIEDAADMSYNVLLDAVTANGITEIAGQDAGTYLWDHDRQDTIAALRAQDVTSLRGMRIANILRDVNQEALQTLAHILKDRGFEMDTFVGAVPEEERGDPIAIARAIRDASIRMLGGTRVSEITAGDRRDAVLDTLRAAGITEINGKPIEDVVVYAKWNIDLIDIAQGKPPRSLAPPEPGAPSFAQVI